MKIPLLLSSLLLSLTASAQFQFAPALPQPGQVVSLTYTTAGTPLATDSTLEARFVRYGSPGQMRLSQPTTLTLVRQGNVYAGELKLPTKDIAGLMMLFRNRQQPRRIDANKGQLYVIPLADETGQLLHHATGGQASVFTRTSLLAEAGVRPNPDYVVTLYEQELAQNPDLKPQYWADYYAALIKQQKPGYAPKVKADIEAYLAAQKPPTTADLTNAARLYESMGDFKNATVQRERMKTVDPVGSVAQKDRNMAVRNEPNWTKKKAGYDAFMRDFPASPYAPGLTVLMTDGYFKASDIPGLMTFVETQPATHTDPMMLNTIAFQLADEKRSLPEAERLVRRAMTLQQATKRPYNFRGDWDAEQRSRQNQMQNTLARTLEQQDKFADAFAAYQTFMKPDDADNSDPNVNERYFLCALRANRAADARPVVEAAIEADRATPRLKTALRTWYAKQPGQTPATATAYLANLEADLKAELRDELRQKLIDRPAPAFALTDLLGRTISSSAFRGKVIVLDFWATWCGPCVASFPAMQQAQERFQSDPNVKFLFVNTREGGPLQRVRTFMDKHPYPFVVPLDSQQKVANAYGVQGIPTKIVIGPNGRVRYRAVGYSNNPDATVEELTLVVEMLKEGM